MLTPQEIHNISVDDKNRHEVSSVSRCFIEKESMYMDQNKTQPSCRCFFVPINNNFQLILSIANNLQLNAI